MSGIEEFGVVAHHFAVKPVLRLLAAYLSFLVPVIGDAEIARPNVLIVYADDLGYGDVSCYGATRIQTPNIDRLPQGGRPVTDAHAPSAPCHPPRYSPP